MLGAKNTSSPCHIKDDDGRQVIGIVGLLILKQNQNIGQDNADVCQEIQGDDGEVQSRVSYTSQK